MRRRVEIPLVGMEFDDGGNTIWVHGDRGGTVLRVKTKGTIHVRDGCELVSHSDIVVDGDIHFCVSDDVKTPPADGTRVTQHQVRRAITVLTGAYSDDAPLNTNDLYAIIGQALIELGVPDRG